MTTQPSLEEAIAVLIGKPLSGTFRVLDMEMFEFGEQVPFTDRRGRARTIGEYRLHVQCSWRIVRAGTILMGYADMTEPPNGVAAVDFDPNTGARTRRDELMDRFLEDTRLDDRVVTGQETTPYGDVRLTFRDGSRLELFPEASASENESWRLLMPDGSHIVMSGAGLERLPPPTMPASG
jgi:hypothetical protein